MHRVLLWIAPVLLVAQAPAPKKTTAPVKPKTTTAAKSAAAKTAAKPATAPFALTTDEEKTIYALGLSIQKSLGQFNLSPHEMEIVEHAMADAAGGKPAIELNEWGPKIGPLARARAASGSEREKAVSKAYIDKTAAEPSTEKTASGMLYRELRAGTGDSPKATDTVKVNYRGTLVDGTEFDSSYKRNEPAQFPLNGVIPCWTEGVQKMKPGGKAMLVCPSDLAYGDQGRPSIPGGAALIFEIELLEVVGAPAK